LGRLNRPNHCRAKLLAELKGVETKVVQHGELGPVLYDRNWSFDTAA
jgi:hypothetical protein